MATNVTLQTAAGKRRRIGIVGFGRLGKYLWERIQSCDNLEVAFVWNRTIEQVMETIPMDQVLENLDDFALRSPDLIVEVAHPSITAKYGAAFLQAADYMIGSPTVLADQSVEDAIRLAAKTGPHGLYVPVGAFWGAEDVRKMADRGTLKSLKVTMSKDPSAFKLTGYLVEKLKTVSATEPTVLYEGSVRGLCPLAPNNVNTMAVGAIAAHNIGFDGAIGKIVAVPNQRSHIVEIEVGGPGEEGNRFTVHTVRHNPAQVGVVTGNATYASFYSSLLGAQGRGGGVHLC